MRYISCGRNQLNGYFSKGPKRQDPSLKKNEEGVPLGVRPDLWLMTYGLIYGSLQKQYTYAISFFMQIDDFTLNCFTYNLNSRKIVLPTWRNPHCKYSKYLDFMTVWFIPLRNVRLYALTIIHTGRFSC